MNGEMNDFDEQELERRKKDQIAYREKKKTSNMFLFVGTICEVLIAFLLILVLFILSAFIVYRLLDGIDTDTQTVIFNILLVITFVGGLAGGFFIYRALGRFVIKKFKLQDKLREDVLNQFKTTKEVKAEINKKNNE